MRNFSITTLLLLYAFGMACCNRTIYTTTKGSNLPVEDVFVQNISKSTKTSFYLPTMKRGDEYILTLVPGLSYSQAELSFSMVSGLDLITTPQEIDKACRFARLVNNILIPGKGLEEGGSLEDMHGIIDISTQKMTSASYNTGFYLTFINSGSINTWTAFTVSVNNWCKVKGKSGYINFGVPQYSFSAELLVLKIERPWIKIPYVDDTSMNSYSPVVEKNAIIKEIIFAKNVKVVSYNNTNLNVKIHNNKVTVIRDSTNISTMNSDSVKIVGFKCMLL